MAIWGALSPERLWLAFVVRAKGAETAA